MITTGTVKFFKDDDHRHFGFIEADVGGMKDVYFKSGELVNVGYTPRRGDRVRFKLVIPRVDRDRPYAERVERI
jgi:cold shock CspA family protein